MYNIAEINLCTEFEGPFKRLAIWFQGCNIRCEGCCNPELQQLIPKHLISLEEIIDIIKKSKSENDIEGITLLGGEPTIQNDLVFLLERVRELDLGIILFTGKQLSDVESNVQSFCDIIVDGKFDINQIETERNLVGSKNQTIHYLTDRYVNCKDWFDVKRTKRARVDIVDDSLIISGDVIIR